MPGKGSYGPGGKWIHDRANRILEKGDLQDRHGDDAKSVAYAIATQQAHKMGKTPKKKGGYGTRDGRMTAKAKYGQPRKEYRKTAEDMTKVNRIFDVLKQASLAGQDLRKGMVGNPRFPTADSKTLSNKLLAKSQKAAEVGPAPMFNKEGSEMSDITSDPLAQYLMKQASGLLKKKSTEPDDPHVRELRAKGKGEFVSTLKALFANAPSDQ